MRTTLDIADDVLLAAKRLACRDNKRLGQVISDLARSALNTDGRVGAPAPAPASAERLARLGIRPLARRGGVVSNELINRLREQEGV
jgi:hypothetical protein